MSTILFAAYFRRSISPAPLYTSWFACEVLQNLHFLYGTL
jgi:hypothetical protein